MKYKALLVVPLVAAMGAGVPRGAAPPAPPVEVRPVGVPETAGALPGPATGAPAEDAAPAARPEAPMLRVLDANEIEPEALQWQARPIAVFADTAQHPSFVQQLQALTANPLALIDRDVVVITDTDPAANSLWRRMLRPEGFSLVIMDKDGQVKLRKPFPWDVREITRAIDKFPTRRQEIGRAGLPR